MMSLFLSQLSILYHLPGRVLTAPPHYLEKAIPAPITMKGSSACVCNGNSLWAARGTLPSASLPSLLPSSFNPLLPHRETERWTAQPGLATAEGKRGRRRQWGEGKDKE